MYQSGVEWARLLPEAQNRAKPHLLHADQSVRRECPPIFNISFDFISFIASPVKPRRHTYSGELPHFNAAFTRLSRRPRATPSHYAKAWLVAKRRRPAFLILPSLKNEIKASKLQSIAFWSATIMAVLIYFSSHCFALAERWALWLHLARFTPILTSEAKNLKVGWSQSLIYQNEIKRALSPLLSAVSHDWALAKCYEIYDGNVLSRNENIGIAPWRYISAMASLKHKSSRAGALPRDGRISPTTMSFHEFFNRTFHYSWRQSPKYGDNCREQLARFRYEEANDAWWCLLRMAKCFFVVEPGSLTYEAISIIFTLHLRSISLSVARASKYKTRLC